MSLEEIMNNGVGSKILVAVFSGLLITSITAFWGLSNSVSTLSAQQGATQKQISRLDKRVTNRLNSFEDRLSYIEREALRRRNAKNLNLNSENLRNN